MTKSPGVPRNQFIFLGVLLLLLIVWASRQCTNSTSMSEEERFEAMLNARFDSLTVQSQATTPPTTEEESAPPPSRPAPATIERSGTPLYITIDNLAMRKGPGLHYEIIDRLPLFDQVDFLNEVTDSLYTIKLGAITPTEPWVRIRNRKGRDGWVYGAGVDFYKRKLEGVE